MSFADQNRIAALEEEMEKLKKGVTTETDEKIKTFEERLQSMEAKYHMLNARLKKYNVD